jgi:hypothetical protein
MTALIRVHFAHLVPKTNENYWEIHMRVGKQNLLPGLLGWLAVDFKAVSEK